MNGEFTEVKISDLFKVETGDFHAKDQLDTGEIPLVSCGDTDNGVIGYFDIPAGKIHHHSITAAYNGSWPLTAKYHPYRFGAKDDVAVLTPITPMQDATLFYVAAMLNRMTWRYSYGRKCFREKLKNVTIPVPVVNMLGDVQIDEAAILGFVPHHLRSVIPANVYGRILHIEAEPEEAQDESGAHWERFQAATRKLLTTPKPAKAKTA